MRMKNLPPKQPRLDVEWLPDERYVDGGSYVLVTAGNRQLFATPTRKGDDDQTRLRLERMMNLWNDYHDKMGW